MGFIFKEEKTIIEVLNGTEKDIASNIDLLAKIYLEKTGRKVCRSCPSDIQYMILSLKHALKMTQFKFKAHAAMYKNKKGDKTTISNSNLTDESAIEFLKTNPERIRLFSEFPSNWETLIYSDGTPETEEEKEKRLSIEAEMKAVKLGQKPSKAVLSKMKLKDLRKMYPTIKATSIKEFVSETLALFEVKKEEEIVPEKVQEEVPEIDSEAAAIAEAEKAAEEAAEEAAG